MDPISIRFRLRETDLKWDFYSWFLETPEYVLLYMTKRTFTVIPKRAFDDEAGVKAFVDLVASKLDHIKMGNVGRR